MRSIKNLKPILNKDGLVAGALYIELSVDCSNRLFLREPFRVVGHPFMTKLVGESVPVVRTSYCREQYGRKRQQVEFLRDCGVEVEGSFDNLHRLFLYSPQTHALFRRLVRHQDKKTYGRLTGIRL